MRRLNSAFTKEQQHLIKCKNKKYQLYFALLFEHFDIKGYFFEEIPKFSRSLVCNVAKKLELETTINTPSNRAYKHYCKEIRIFYNVPATSEQHQCFDNFLCEKIFTENNLDKDSLLIEVGKFLSEKRILRFTDDFIAQSIKRKINQYEQYIFNQISSAMDSTTKAFLDGLMIIEDGASRMTRLGRWMEGTNANNVYIEIDKLKFLKKLKLPSILQSIDYKILKKHYRSIRNKYPSAIKEIGDDNRHALLAIFCYCRKIDITDNLIEILNRLIHKSYSSGYHKSKRILAQYKNLKKSYNAKHSYRQIIDVLLTKEIVNVKLDIYPLVPKKKLEALQEDLHSEKANNYSNLSYSHSRDSFVHYYRRVC